MLIRSVNFHRAAYRAEDFVRDGRPQFAFVGKSNVGKSTLINALINRRNLARVSSTPGKTQAVQYYVLNEKVYFVDLPGYGYAKVSKEMRYGWSELMGDFFTHQSELRILFLLLDSRREPTEDDAVMLEFAREAGTNVIPVMTKSDKLSNSEVAKSTRLIGKALEVDPALIIAFSSINRRGVDEIWSRIDASLKATGEKGTTGSAAKKSKKADHSPADAGATR